MESAPLSFEQPVRAQRAQCNVTGQLINRHSARYADIEWRTAAPRRVAPRAVITDRINFK